MTPHSTGLKPGFELRFSSLFSAGRGWVFPCDVNGGVDLDSLSVRARNNYFFVHSVIGREVTAPTVFALGGQEHPEAGDGTTDEPPSRSAAEC